MTEFPFQHIVNEINQQVWIRATYAESKEIPLLISKFYPGYSWHLIPQDMFESLLENSND